MKIVILSGLSDSMGLISWLKSALVHPGVVAKVEQPGFIESAEIQREGREYHIKISFSDTVKKGNDVEKINIGREGEQIESSVGLVAGDMGSELVLDEYPAGQAYRLVVVDGEGQIVSESVLKVERGSH